MAEKEKKTEVSKTKKTTTKPEGDNLKTENESLKEELAKLQETVNKLMSTQAKEKKVDDQLDMNLRISVTSLVNGGVNLRTSTDGTAKIFRFEKLGQTLPILYIDLINCINVQREMFEDGTLYINSEQVVMDNYLEDHYKKFISIDKITNILNFDSSTIQKLVNNTTREIQETIIRLVADKINAGNSIDMNKVDVIGKACNPAVDIRELSLKLR